jgi:predicted Zn-dependent protease with MMP-like domain
MDTTLYVVTDSPDGRSVNRANAYRFVLLDEAQAFASRLAEAVTTPYIHEVHYQYVESELVD